MSLVLRGGRLVGRTTVPVVSLSTPETTAPTTPTSLTTSGVTTTQVVLTWGASTDTGGSGLLGYVVYRDVSGVDVQIGFVESGTTFTATGLTAATSYTFRVRAQDNAGNLSVPANVAVSTLAAADTTPPTDPTSFTSSVVTTTTLTLGWGASTDTGSGVKGYHVYQVVSGVDTELTSSSSPTTATTWNVTGLTASTSYTFKVEAEDNAGNRSNKVSHTVTTAAPDTTAPTAPTNLTVTSKTQTTIDLSWTASTDVGGTVVKYQVYLVVSGSNVKQGDPTGTTFQVTGLTANTEYTMRVRAVDSSNNNSTLTSITETTLAVADTTPPTAPTGLAASSIAQTSFTLSWTASTDDVGVVKYLVFDTTLATYQEVTSGTTANVTGLTAGTAYQMRVQAVDAAGNSSTASAAALEVTTAAATPVGAGPPAAPARMINHPIGLAAGVQSSGAEVAEVAAAFSGNCGHVRIDASPTGVEGNIAMPSYEFTLRVNAATGGTYKLKVEVDGGDYQETAAIAWDASNATIQAAIIALSNVPSGGVSVTGTATKTLDFGAGGLSDNPVWVVVSDNSLTPTTATVVANVVPYTISSTSVRAQRTAAARGANAKVVALTAYSAPHSRDLFSFNGTTKAGNKVTVNSITGGYSLAPASGLPEDVRVNTLTIKGPGITGNQTTTGRSGDDINVSGGVTAGQTGTFTLGDGPNSVEDNQSVPKNPAKYGCFVGRLAASSMAPEIIEEDNEINHLQARRIGPDPEADHHRLCHGFVKLMLVNPNARIVTAGIANVNSFVIGGPRPPYPGQWNWWKYLTGLWDYCESTAGKNYWAAQRAKLPSDVPSSDTYPFHGISLHAHQNFRFNRDRVAGGSNVMFQSDPSYYEDEPHRGNPLSYLPRLQLEMIRRDPDWLGRCPFYLTENGVKNHTDATTGLGIRLAILTGCTVTDGSATVQGNFSQTGLANALTASTGLAGVPNTTVFPTGTTCLSATNTTLTMSNPANTSRTNATIFVLGLPVSSSSTSAPPAIHYYPTIYSPSEAFIHKSRTYRVIAGQYPYPYTSTSPKFSPSSVWRYTITATGGNYKWQVQVDGGTAQTTANIAWNASNATIQAAIQALSNVPTGCVVVTGASTTKTVTFTAPAGADPGLNDSDVTITLTGSSLTGGGITGPTDRGIRPAGFPRGQPPIACYSDFVVKAPGVNDTIVEDGLQGFIGFFDERKRVSGTTRDFTNTSLYTGDPAGNDMWDALSQAP